MNIVVRVLLTLVLLVSVGLVGYDTAVYYLYSPWTRDGRVRADVVTVAADVSGYVTDLRVHSNQAVKKGDILFVVDQARYRIALATAEAAVAASLAQYQMLQQQYERRSKLTLNLSISPEDLENIHRQAQSANAAWQQAIADRDLAALNLKRTEVRATVNGFVTNLNLQNGDYASPGRRCWRLSTATPTTWTPIWRKPRSRRSRSARRPPFGSWTARRTCKEALKASLAASPTTTIAMDPNFLTA
jgi:multidrug resistance efflux pump